MIEASGYESPRARAAALAAMFVMAANVTCGSAGGGGGFDGGIAGDVPHDASDDASRDASRDGPGADAFKEAGAGSGNACNSCLAGCQGMDQCCTGTGCMCESECSNGPCPVGMKPSVSCDLEGDCMTGCVSAGTGSGGSSGSTSSGSSSGSSSTGSSSGFGSSGSSGAGIGCTPLSTVASSEIPVYAAVVQQLNACSATDIDSFVAACMGSVATSATCLAWENDTTYAGCLGCILTTPSNVGGMLVDYTGQQFVGVNTPGCIALTDATNGPACAAAYEPWIQCYVQACASAACDASQTALEGCAAIADGAGGACNSRSSLAVSACQSDYATGGVGYTQCGTDTQVLNVICGSGG